MKLCILTGLGALAGLPGGCPGIGASAIAMPLVTGPLWRAREMARGISRTVMIPLAIIGTVPFRFRPASSPGPLGLRMAGAVGGSILGSTLANRSPARQQKLAFALFAITAGVVLPAKA